MTRRTVAIQDCAAPDDERYRAQLPMAQTVPVIGIEPAELNWIRMLVLLLRHPDPVVPELTRQALLYLEASADGNVNNRTNI
jgi:hypothetical protein